MADIIAMAKAPKKGDCGIDANGEHRVMGCIDNWVMVRRPRCIPFVIHISDWRAALAAGDESD